MSDLNNNELPNEPEAPKYHFKWMLALMLVAMLATFIFELVKKNYAG